MIVRSPNPERFTVVNNIIIEDDRLDWPELGLLIYLLSKPDNWQVSPAHLSSKRKAGRDKIYSILKKLCEVGYVKKKPNPKGGWDWWVYESPNTENTDTESVSGNSGYGKTRIRKSRNLVSTENKTNTEPSSNARARTGESPGRMPNKQDSQTSKATARRQMVAKQIQLDWKPGKQVYSWAEKNDISQDFVDSQVDEFIAYWSDVEQPKKSWNSTFINNLKRKLDYERSKRPLARRAPKSGAALMWASCKDGLNPDTAIAQ